MDEYNFEGVIKLRFKLKSKTSSHISKETLENDFKMNTTNMQNDLKEILKELDKNTSLSSIFPLNHKSGHTEMPLIFIETEKEHHIYIYKGANTTEDNFNCIVLLNSKEDLFHEFKSILGYLKGKFSDQKYILEFNKPDDIEGYLIKEDKELLFYYQNLSYITPKDLNFLEKVSELKKIKINKFALYAEIFLTLIIIYILTNKSIEIPFLDFSRKDLLLLLVPFWISFLTNFIILYFNKETEVIKAKNLEVYAVNSRDLTKEEVKVNKEIEEVNNAEIAIKE